MHLPPQKETSMYFVRDVHQNREDMNYNLLIFNAGVTLKRNNVKAVPHIFGLRVDDMLWPLSTNKMEGSTIYLVIMKKKNQ